MNELVKIRWVDIAFYEGPIPAHKLDDCTPIECETVGFLLRDGEGGDVVVASSMGEDEGITSYEDINVIPKEVVREIKYLKEPEEGKGQPES